MAHQSATREGRDGVALTKYKPAAATSREMAAWKYRSRLLSELRETIIIAARLTALGIITRKPMAVFE